VEGKHENVTPHISRKQEPPKREVHTPTPTTSISMHLPS
jgi:hypothetical protein